MDNEEKDAVAGHHEHHRPQTGSGLPCKEALQFAEASAEFGLQTIKDAESGSVKTADAFRILRTLLTDIQHEVSDCPSYDQPHDQLHEHPQMSCQQALNVFEACYNATGNFAVCYAQYQKNVSGCTEP